MKPLSKNVKALLIGCLVVFSLIALNSVTAKNTTASFKRGYCVDVAYKPTEDKKVAQIQQQISKIYDKLLQSTVRVSVGNSGASAVLISEDGYILTAAHVIDAIGDVEGEVRLHDGSVYNAKCLGKDVAKDYGLMKIEPTKKLVFSKMGTASNLAKDEACLMFGHPASSEDDRPAIARIGFYKGINDNDYLKTTCVMMPGDSGGPLFDLNGYVVGICSYINRGLDQNYYPSVDNVKKNWEKLIKGEVFNNTKMTYGNTITEAPDKGKPYVLEGGKKTLVNVLSEQKDNYAKALVRIKSILNDKNNSSQGTIISKKGYIVAKSSEIGNTNIYCTLYDDSQVKAKIIGRDKANDLVVLKINTSKKLQPINLNKSSKVETGQLLGTVVDNGAIVFPGILGLETREITSKDKGFLGIYFAQQPNVVIENVLENGAAQKAGLQSGDQIISFNTITINKRQDLLKALHKTKPEQEVNITYIRNDIESEVEVILGKRTSNNQHRHRHHPADYTKTNDVKDGFPQAFTHDMPLEKEQSGTPVFNLKGEIIGINIARRNRTSSLAIPTEHIVAIVKKILSGTESNHL